MQSRPELQTGIGRLRKTREDGPVLDRIKRLNLPFTIDGQAKCDRLNPSCREASSDLAP